MSRLLKTAVATGLAFVALGLGPVRAQDASVRVAGEPLTFSQPRAVTSLDIDPGGERVIASGLDGAVRTWNLSTGTPGPVFQIHQGDAAAARFTRDGRRILSTGADGRAVLTDASDGTAVRAWRFPTWCLGLAVIDADTAAVGCADLKIRVLDLDEDAVEREIQAPGDLQYQYVTSLSASPDGRMLASSNPAALYDVATGEQLRTSGSFVQRFIFSPDGRWLLGGNMKAGAQLWSVDPLQARIGVLTDVEQQVQTPSGRQAARQRMPIYGVVWSTDGRFFATGGLDLLVRVWRIQGEGPPVEAARLEGHRSAISALAWRGDRLVSGDLGGQVRIWRLEGLD